MSHFMGKNNYVFFKALKLETKILKIFFFFFKCSFNLTVLNIEYKNKILILKIVALK